MLDKILPYEAWPEFPQTFRPFFGQSSLKKMLWKFTDLYQPLDLKKVGTRHLDDKLIGSLAPLKCNSSYLISVRLLPKVKPFCALACNPEICKT